MDASTAALLGAGIGAAGGALTTAIGSLSSIWWDRQRHQRDLEDARSARLFERRLEAHQVMMDRLLRTQAWAERIVKRILMGSERTDDPPFPDEDLSAALATVKLLSSGPVSAAGAAAVAAVSKFRYDNAIQFDRLGGTMEARSSRIGGSWMGLRNAVDEYRRLLQVDIGVSF
jgi:hypothetical protein